MASKVGKLSVLITASSKGFNSGMKKAESRLSKFQANVKAKSAAAAGLLKGVALSAGLSAAGIGLAFSSASKRIDDLSKSSKKLLGNDGATGALRGIRLAAGEAGIEAENLDKSFEKMLDTMGAAKNGEKTAQKAFERLGISMAELRRLSPEEVFLRLGDAIDALPTPDEKINASRDIFGKAGGDLVSLFSGGSDAIRQAQADIQNLGLAMSGVESNKVEQMNDAFERTKLALSGFMEQVVLKMAPAITDLSQRFVQMITDIGGMGSAVDTAFSFIVENVSTVLDAIESIRTKWLGMIAAAQDGYARILNFIDKIAGSGTSDVEREKVLQDRLQSINPEKRAEFERLARGSGGFQDERITVKGLANAFNDEAKSNRAGQDAAKKQIAEKGTLGQRFEAYIQNVDEKATDAALSAQKSITDEKREQLDLTKAIAKEGEAKQGAFGLTAFNGPVFEAAANKVERATMGEGKDTGTETNRLLGRIDQKLGRGVTASYA